MKSRLYFRQGFAVLPKAENSPKYLLCVNRKLELLAVTRRFLNVGDASVFS